MRHWPLGAREEEKGVKPMTNQDKTKESVAAAPGEGADPFDMQTADQALKSLHAKLAAIAVGKIQSFRAPVAQVVANIMRVYRSFREDSERLTATFKPEAFSPAAYDDLPVRAQALWHADTKLRQLLDPTGISVALVAKAEPLKKKIFRAASYLWGDDPEIGSQIDAIRAGNGYLDLADDLVALSGVFGAHWSFASGKCDITEADLAAARGVASELMTALVGRDASRETAGRDIAQVRDVRDRAATYAREGIDDVRAAAAFIYRRDSEAWTERYPSFFQGIGGHRRRAAVAEPAPTTTVPPAVPSRPPVA
jgi:hypothetical protein